jgi:CelD/BcsL family acetyltransferase involved in cellulose biosynthesis
MAYAEPIASQPNGNRVRIALHAGRNAALAAVDALPADIVCSGFQSPDFLRAWLHHTPYEPAFMSFMAEGAGPVLLPLELADKQLLCYAGESHANANFPVGRAQDIAALTAAGEKAIVTALRDAKPRGNALLLERQLEDCRGVPNPFVFENSAVSPNVSLALSLEGGFDAVLSRHSAKRKRKRFRQQEREFGQIGGYRFVSDVKADDVPDLLKRLFALKTEQFREQGIHDVFADAYVQDFLTELFVEGTKSSPQSRVLKTLEADGKTVAIVAASIHDGRMIAEFGSYDTAYSHCSPGDMLFFNIIREATENGLEIFDFSVGEAFYKRGWCEIETWHRDTVIPLNSAGRMIAATAALRASAVRAIKSNPQLWNAVKEFRKRVPLLR